MNFPLYCDSGHRGILYRAIVASHHWAARVAWDRPSTVWNLDCKHISPVFLDGTLRIHDASS